MSWGEASRGAFRVHTGSTGRGCLGWGFELCSLNDVAAGVTYRDGCKHIFHGLRGQKNIYFMVLWEKQKRSHLYIHIRMYVCMYELYTFTFSILFYGFAA